MRYHIVDYVRNDGTIETRAYHCTIGRLYASIKKLILDGTFVDYKITGCKTMF